MFETSLVESTSMLRRRSRWPVLVSVFAQACIALALIAVPLLHPEALSLAEMHVATLLPPPPMRASPPQPPRPVRVVVAAANAMMAPPTRAATLPLIRTLGSSDPAPAPETGFNLSPETGNPLHAMSGVGAPASPSVGVAPAGTAHAGAMRISTGVSAGLLLGAIRPVYPRIAVISRIEGTVVVDAIITRSGSIASAHIVSGPPMLQGAAIEAVRSAHYKAYLLNGEPTEVETTISIVFHLSN